VTAFRPISEAARSWSDDNNVSQGSLATHARCGGIFNLHLTANLPGNLPVIFFLNWLRFDRITAMSLLARFLAHPAEKNKCVGVSEDGVHSTACTSCMKLVQMLGCLTRFAISISTSSTLATSRVPHDTMFMLIIA